MGITREKSHELYAATAALIPGGVSSPARSFRGVGGGAPVFITRAEGAYLWDADGNRYVDYVCGYGPVILGHGHPAVAEAVARAVRRGAVVGAPTPAETQLALAIRQAIPAMERLFFGNSGAEAVEGALKLARAATGRPGVVKFEGAYHGHSDAVLVKAGSGAATVGVTDSAGTAGAAAGAVHALPYNDLEPLRELFRQRGETIACVLVEPIAGNMGIVPPAPGFLEGVRDLARAHGALVVFDEIITGFRVAYGAAQQALGVTPDLTCLGKVIGGGLPLAAYGGRADLMALVAPEGPVFQAGTHAGNPLSVAAGLATLEVLARPGVYDVLDDRAAYLAAHLEALAREAGCPVRLNRWGSMFTLFFTDGPVTDYRTALRADREAFSRFFFALLDRGVHLAPSPFEAWFLTLAHEEEHLAASLEAAREAFRAAGHQHHDDDAPERRVRRSGAARETQAR